MRYSPVLMLLLLGACATTTQAPPVVVPAGTHITTATTPNTRLFDSLADTAGLARPIAAGVAFDAEGARALAWLDVLRDSTLTGLVRTALRDNRDLHTAIGRVNEYRALSGSARSRLFPEIDGTASVSRNRIVFAGTPIEYSAYTAAATLQWELDFWGHIRQGIAAAEADQAARVDDERVLALTLVADISASYLALLEAREDIDIAQRTLCTIP